MDSDKRHNSYELTLENDGLHQESFYANKKGNFGLYEVGKRVLIAYALDELKNQNREGKCSKTPIEIAISNDVVPAAHKIG